MKKAFSLILLLAMTSPAFAQGKLGFFNDPTRLIYFTPDNWALAWPDADKIVGGFPLAGSSAYTGPGSTIAALAGFPSFTVGLFGGATAGSLTLRATTTMADVNFAGEVNPVNVTFADLPAGVPAYFQVQVFDSRATSASGAWDMGGYAGESPIFTAVPQASVYSPIYQTSAPVSSTWAAGTFTPKDYAGFPGYQGAIEVWVGIPDYWLQTSVVGSGTITATPSGPYYFHNAGVVLTATATAGWAFDHWTGDVTGSQNPVSLTMDRSHSVQAVFLQVGFPLITQQPISQLGYCGKSVIFDVAATNNPPLGYQWQKDGAAISGATRTSLVLANLQTTNAGRYTVVVTNSLGSITSSNAYLAVNPPGVSLALYSGLTIGGVAGRAYGIQYNTGLTNSSGWQGMTNLTLDVLTGLWFDVEPATQYQRFYRVVPGPIPIP
jgi:hypothetical protein